MVVFHTNNIHWQTMYPFNGQFRFRHRMPSRAAAIREILRFRRCGKACQWRQTFFRIGVVPPPGVSLRLLRVRDVHAASALSGCFHCALRHRVPPRVIGRNRYRDSPLRGGASLIALRLGRASIAGRAEPSITVAAARSSSIVQYELRCFSRSQRSPAFTCREVMRIVVLQETPVPGRASRRRRSVHISHSRFAGLLRRSPFGSQLPGEMDVLPFCSSHWSRK